MENAISGHQAPQNIDQPAVTRYQTIVHGVMPAHGFAACQLYMPNPMKKPKRLKGISIPSATVTPAQTSSPGDPRYDTAKTGTRDIDRGIVSNDFVCHINLQLFLAHAGFQGFLTGVRQNPVTSTTYNCGKA
jgi:hypothetical protein